MKINEEKNRVCPLCRDYGVRRGCYNRCDQNNNVVEKEKIHLNIEIIYQPINKQWSASISFGNNNFFEVDSSRIVAINKVLEKYDNYKQ